MCRNNFFTTKSILILESEWKNSYKYVLMSACILFQLSFQVRSPPYYDVRLKSNSISRIIINFIETRLLDIKTSRYNLQLARYGTLKK